MRRHRPPRSMDRSGRALTPMEPVKEDAQNVARSPSPSPSSVNPPQSALHDGRTPSPPGWNRDTTPFEAFLKERSTTPAGPTRRFVRYEAPPPIRKETSAAIAASVPTKALSEVPIAPVQAVESPTQLSLGDLVMLVFLSVLAWDLANILCVVIIQLYAEDEQQCGMQSSVSSVSQNTLLGVTVGSYAATFDCIFLGCKPVVSTITWFVFLTLSSSWNALYENESAAQQDDIFSNKELEPSLLWTEVLWQCLFQKMEPW